jgi:hypothetical protein
LQAAILELEDVRDHDFAYSDVHEALNRIESKLRQHERDLLDQDPNPDPSVLAAECQAALKSIAESLPVLGFIVRSATVRNAFEMYGPLRKMVQTLLKGFPARDSTKPDVKLILSSGWDYMPLTLRPLDRLEDFVFIVLPTTEASNPLLIPLAGHEFGHAVWARANIWDALQEVATKKLADYLRTNLGKFADLKAEDISENEMVERLSDYPHLKRQLEEYFCALLSKTNGIWTGDADLKLV